MNHSQDVDNTLADLERNAAENRDRVDQTAHKLIDKVVRMGPAHELRMHFTGVAIALSTIAFLSGYVVGAVSSDR